MACFFFAVDKRAIQNCLQNPASNLSQSLTGQLKVLLAMISGEKARAPSVHREFWKNMINMIKSAIDHLSGQNTEVIYFSLRENVYIILI